MDQLKLNITSETSQLGIVVLGIADSPGPVPTLENVYDPKSWENIQNGTYPKETDMVMEMEAFNKVFLKHGVEVLRPENIENCNQIFTRDIAFVIDDYLFKSNILPLRESELQAINYIIAKINPEKVISLPENVHVEGGDVMMWKDYIFIGTYKGENYADFITARTNLQAVKFLTEFFPNKKVVDFDLIKSNTRARENALHLDCIFQPVGENYGIIYKDGFRDKSGYDFLVSLFGIKNLFHITQEEMYNMYSNVFSIAPDIVVSEKGFTRLNTWLREKDILVEEIPYKEISKQEGLLRCSTLPLYRYE
ncbi:MAG: arginine deiminase-related protein [Cyclobacteriaceae bacterium]|nr:arginine deiminase-related protein [Cyclobacteriaceae bacterium]